MEKVSEQKINNLTKRHVARSLSKLEKEHDIPFWMIQIIRTEFWLFNQNIKEILYSSGCIDLDVKDKPWFPNHKEERNNSD